jgi:hypothetical protein
MKRMLAALATLLAIACGSAGQGSVGTKLNIYELKFKAMDSVGKPVYCDPDFYPVAREGGEQASAIQQYPDIRSVADRYAAIIAHERLPSGELTDAQKLVAYRAFKLLRAVTLNPNGNEYTFEFRVQSPSDGIELVNGTVRIDGVVTVKSRSASGPPNCPICLAASVTISTPRGAIPVTQVRPGMLIWTANGAGERIAMPVLEVGSTPVPAGHLMVHLRLADDRELLASPGHRTSDGRRLGSLAVGDHVDGSTVAFWELVPYAGERTYDLLPAGATGTYWANGVLLSSTLSR